VFFWGLKISRVGAESFFLGDSIFFGVENFYRVSRIFLRERSEGRSKIIFFRTMTFLGFRIFFEGRIFFAREIIFWELMNEAVKQFFQNHFFESWKFLSGDYFCQIYFLGMIKFLSGEQNFFESWEFLGMDFFLGFRIFFGIIFFRWREMSGIFPESFFSNDKISIGWGIFQKKIQKKSPLIHIIFFWAREREVYL